MQRSLDQVLFLLRALDTENDPFALEQAFERAMMINDDAELERLGSKAAKRFPSFYEFYGRQALDHLPQWDGAEGALKTYDQSLQHKLGSDHGLIALSFIVDRLFEVVGYKDIVKETGLDWRTILSAYAAREKL